MSIISDLVQLYQVWGSWKDNQISEEEKEILIQAQKNGGKINLISTDQTGEFVRIGRKDYISESDPSIRARALESIEKLYRRGLIRHEGGIVMELTGTGFDFARKYTKSS